MDMQGMKVKILVGAGRNQLISQVGNFTKLYDATIAMHNTNVELAINDVYVGGACNAMALRCIGPVVVTGNRADGTQLEVRVNGMLFLDEVFTGFRVINSGTQMAKVWINYATSALGSAANGVQSVNGNLPDGNGNVEVDTGVLTVDSVPPDAAGNVDVSTDEGNYEG